jgi:hypothetical protein
MRVRRELYLTLQWLAKEDFVSVLASFCLVGNSLAPRYGRLSSHRCLFDPGNFSISTELLTYRGRFSLNTQKILSKPALR